MRSHTKWDTNKTGRIIIKTLLLILILLTSTSNLYAISHGIVLTNSEFPNVIKYRVKDANGSGYSCTGTYIKHNLIITAAHCLEGRDIVSINGISEKSSYSIHPLYQNPKDKYDLAFIKTDARGSTDSFPSLNINDKIDSGLPIILIGYGLKVSVSGLNKAIIEERSKVDNINYLNELSSIKRKGVNYLYRAESTLENDNIVFVSDEIELFDFEKSSNIDEKVSGSYFGDSGGPIFQGEKIIGLMVGQTSFGKKCFNQGTNLQLKENRNFINSMLINH